MPKTIYRHLGPTKYWCQICDSCVVDSQNPNTGSFYAVFGVVDPATDTQGRALFAICPDCKKEQVIHAVSIEAVLVKAKSEEQIAGH